MKRRDFLKGLSIAPLVVAIPSLLKAEARFDKIDQFDFYDSSVEIGNSFHGINVGDIITIGEDKTKYIATKVNQTTCSLDLYLPTKQKAKTKPPYYRGHNRRNKYY